MARGKDYRQLVIACCYGLCLLVSQFGPILSEGSPECQQTICQRKREVLRCPASQVLVTNVTSSTGERDDVMLRHVTRACMGKSTCDVSGLCKNRHEEGRVVSYYCVQDTPDSKTCTGSAIILSEPHGFLQNPNYPAAGPYRACHWRIELQAGNAVHLRLFDLASVHRSEGRCDGGLHVSAQKCGRPREPYTTLLCADGETRSSSSSQGRAGRAGGGKREEEEEKEGAGEGREVTLVSCGPVDVRLVPARHAYPLRFWLAYSVTDSVRTEEVGRSLEESGLLVQCPLSSGPGRSAGRGFESQEDAIPPVTPVKSTTMATTSNHSVTSASGASSAGGTSDNQDSTMTVLIVLVCVIGFIALVLSVILIIVCMRRRRPKIEHVYAVPSTCQALSHTYLGDDDPPPEPVPRPRLVQAYSDVADARPPGQPPQVTPASPAYAEVEEVADVDADDKSRKRFHFRFRKRPSVSSTGGNSALYEDVNPVPVNNASVCKSNAAATKNNTLPKYSGSKLNSSPVGPYSTGGVKKGGKRGGESPKTVRESPVYVHVVDSGDVNSATNPSNTFNTSTEKRPVAPLAAKFIANIDKSATNKVGTRGKTEASTRLYPLQEGRVANLVSTLNRKKDTKNGVTAKEETEQVS